MLRYSADLRTLFFIALYFGLTAVLWITTPQDLAATDLRLAIPLFIVVCITSFQGAVSTHNGVHCPIFKKRGLNKIWQVVLTLSYGHPVSSYVPGHNLSHHKHTQSERDVMRTTKTRFRIHNGLNLLFFMVRCIPGIMKADTAYTKTMRTRHPRWFRQMVYELIALWGVTGVLLFLDWRKTILFWLIPHFYAQWGIVTMNLLQHDGCDENSEFNHSRNFVGKLVNWFTFNNGFHTVHHMKPGLHWSLTPAAHAEMVAPHIHPNLDQKSLAAYCFRAFILGKRETYDGKPYAPAPAGTDVPWTPHPRETLADLGAESLDDGHDALNAMVAHSVK